MGVLGSLWLLLFINLLTIHLLISLGTLLARKNMEFKFGMQM